MRKIVNSRRISTRYEALPYIKKLEKDVFGNEPIGAALL